jgi:heme exporter protein C
VFIFVPTDVEMGVIQRIFYFHVPLAWVAFFAFFVVFLGSVLYLWKRSKTWDFVASSSAEVGLVFTTLFLITGSIWAKPVWGVWWTWDARLTASLVLWLIYLAYFIVRSYVAEEGQRARFAAIVGIVGFIDVPIVALAITLWRTQHPGAIIFEGGLVPEMLWTLLVSIFAFTALYFLLFRQRFLMKEDEEAVMKLKTLIRG